MRRPGGATAPSEALDFEGRVIDLEPLAREICAGFYLRYPDELKRSGETGTEWCLHDNQYLLAWAIQEARDGTVSFAEQAVWLAGVLSHRGFPLALLVGNLRIASELMRGRGDLGPLAARTADVLSAGASAVDAIAASRSPDGRTMST